MMHSEQQQRHLAPRTPPRCLADGSHRCVSQRYSLRNHVSIAWLQCADRNHINGASKKFPQVIFKVNLVKD